MLIAIDDLQWVDDLSLGLIHYLLQAAAATRQALIVIAAARPAPIAATFSAGIDVIVPAGQRVQIELGPLALQEGLSLAHALNANLGDSAAAELWRRARGGPRDDLEAAGVEFRVVPDTGHMMALQNPRGLAATIAEILAESWPRDQSREPVARYVPVAGA